MDQRHCDRCGAENPSDAVYCWQCHARWGGAHSGAAPTRTGMIRAASFKGDATSPVLTASPDVRPAQAAERSWSRLVLTGLFLVVGFAGGWWLVDRLFFSGFPFPDQVAGQPRVESELATDASEAIASIGEIFDVEMEMAFYGTGVTPVYVMFAFEVPDSPILPQATPVGPGGEVAFQCMPDVQGSACVWSRDDTIVGLAGVGQTVEQIDPVARAVQADVS
jgi:hypothetical protein